MSGDIATRIRAELNGYDIDAAGQIDHLTGAIRAVLNRHALTESAGYVLCRECTVKGHVAIVWPCTTVDDIAEALGCSDSPARGTTSGSQPRAGVPTRTHPLAVAVSVALAGHVWDEPLPHLSVSQLNDLVSIVERCVREDDEQWLAAEVRADRTTDAMDRGE